MPDEFEYDFSGLTTEQEWLLCYQGWYVGCKYPPNQPSKKTVAKLIKRGLVIPKETVITDRLGSYTVTEYQVPLHVHMAYCMQCDGEEEANV